MNDVRPIRFVGVSDQRELERALAKPVADWAKSWFATPPSLSLESRSFSQVAANSEAWHVRGAMPDSWVAWHAGTSMQTLLRYLFTDATDDHPKDGLGESVALECLSDLADRVLDTAGLRSSPAHVPAATRLPIADGSGSQCVRLVGGEAFGEMLLGFGGNVVEILATPTRSTPPPRTLQSRSSALGNSRVTLEVRLGEAELSVAELSTIAVGDVIALDALSHDPLVVRTIDGRVACHAYLGRIAERKIVQVSGR